MIVGTVNVENLSEPHAPQRLPTGATVNPRYAAGEVNALFNRRVDTAANQRRIPHLLGKFGIIRTARVIAEVNADILVLAQVESRPRPTLPRHRPLAPATEPVHSHRRKRPRGIDVGVLGPQAVNACTPHR